MNEILIIKLGAMGDVLRTTPLLLAYKRAWPQCRITWLVEPASAPVLESNPLIDTLWLLSPDIDERLRARRFDLAINLDKDEPALDALMAARAEQKKGFGRTLEGSLCAADSDSEYAYRLGIDDELKFRQNRKTYQEITFEQAGLCWRGEEYLFSIGSEEKNTARKLLENLDVVRSGRPVVGLNTGSGARFAGKKLPLLSYARLAERFYDRLGAEVLLLGGDAERERNARLLEMIATPVKDTGSHPIRVFAALVANCDVVVSGDTIAMHVAIAMKVPAVVFFASTCAAEIELYGRGAKIVSRIECSPCYKRVCPIDEQCMKDTDVQSLFSATAEILNNRGLKSAQGPITALEKRR